MNSEGSSSTLSDVDRHSESAASPCIVYDMHTYMLEKYDITYNNYRFTKLGTYQIRNNASHIKRLM